MELSASQFALAPQSFDRALLPCRESFGPMQIRSHPRLAVNRAESPAGELLLLGHAIDPLQPDLQNLDVVRQLADGGTSFDRLEERMARLGGRWLLLARIGDELRLYPDAGGTKSVFYSADGWIASQPGHFGYPVDRTLSTYPHAGAWPLGHTPFAGVQQLLPNHYLDLKHIRPVRFGPRKIESTSIEAVSKEIRTLLSGTIAAVLKRGSVALPLTGGFDSRTLLSAAHDYLAQIRLFSILDHKTDRHDYVLPKLLARKAGRPLQFVTSVAVEDVDQNTCGLYQDPNSSRLGAFAQADFVLLGHLSEILRCFYWKDGNPSPVSAKSLSQLAGFAGDLTEVFGAWLDGIPFDDAGRILDLFYWECRVGNWSSVCCTALDGYCEVISPYNCRRLLELGLGLDPSYRRHPYELHRRLCRPEYRSVPFNETRLESIEAMLPKWFPWRLRMRLRHLARPRISS